MADAEATATAQTTANFGESEFGDRLDYGKSQYQDLWAFIAFYVHVVAILVIGIILGAGGGDSDATPSPTFAPNSISYGTGTGTGTGTVVIDFDFSGIFVTLVCGLVAGAIFAILWLKLLQLFAESIIKILLFVQIGCWVAVAVIGLAYDAIYLTVIGIIFALIFSLYTWCVWSRIPFAGACLAVASTVTMLYHGVVWYALIMVFFNFIWNCIWMTTAGGYFTQTASEDQSNVVIFLLLVSFYWGVNVWRNVSHTTTCGVAATWYFNPGQLINPSRASFKRAMTTSFGSICFGSLLVALLQALRGMLRNSGCKGCLICILACIERLMRYFNAYAFAQVAIYGTNFWTSASRTVDLFMKRGIFAIVNDNLSGLALTCGAMLGLVVSGFTCYLVGNAYYPIDDNILYMLLVIFLIIIGGFLGYFVVVIVLLTVASGVIAIFVCFAEDPAALATNRPEQYAKFTESKPELLQMSQNVQQGKDGIANDGVATA
eukprot:354987_1